MQSHAQRVVPGVVTCANNGTTISGATVLAKWTMVGTVTDLAPGSGKYVMISSLFKKATVHMQKGRKFTVMANKSGIITVIPWVLQNGTDMTSIVIEHDQIIEGGVLHCAWKKPYADEFVRMTESNLSLAGWHIRWCIGPDWAGPNQ